MKNIILVSSILIRCFGKLVPETNKIYNYSIWIAVIFMCISMNVSADAPADIKTDSKKSEESKLTYSDNRLNQKVTYTAKIKPVREVLTDLTTMTGVEFYCGSNSKDWQVKDRKLIIFVKDVPLGSLKASIARVLKMKWKETDDSDKIIYRLIQDQKALTDEEKRQKKILEAAKLEHYNKSKQALDNIINAANMSQGQLENLKEKEPYLYLLGTTGIANAVKTLVNDVPEAKTALQGGNPIDISNARITPNIRSSIMKALTGIAELFSKISDEDLFGITKLKDNISDISINIHNQFNYDDATKRSWPGNVDLRIGDYRDSMPPMTQSNAYNIKAKEILKFLDEPAKTFIDDRTLELMKAAKSDEIDIDEQPIQHPDDPLLLKEIQIKDKYRKYREYLSAMANEANINIVSDSLGDIRRVTYFENVPNKKASILEYLDAIGSRFSTNWEKNGDIIEYRNKEWFKKRVDLIPDEIVNRWKDKLRSTGTLDLNDLSQIVMLKENQKKLNIFSDELLSSSKILDSFEDNNTGHSFFGLECYARMTDQQKIDLFSSPGIKLKASDENNREYLIFSSRGYSQGILLPEEEINSNTNLYFSCSMQPIDGCYKYIFAIKNNNNKIFEEQTMLTPKYQPVVEKIKPEDKKAETKSDQK